MKADSRQPRRRRRPGKLTYLVIGLVVVMAAAWTVIIVAGGASKSNEAAAGTAATASSSAKPFKIEPPPPDIASQPTHLTVTAIGVDTDVVPYTVEEAKQGWDGLHNRPCYEDGVITCVDPSSMGLVYWQMGGLAGVQYGDMPGADTRGTVYLHGHAGDPAKQPVFNELPNLQPGDTAELSTAYGVFTYTVEKVRNIPKDDYPYDPEMLEQVPGRLLLVTCFHGQGATTVGGYATDNTVAILQLTGNRALSS